MLLTASLGKQEKGMETWDLQNSERTRKAK